VSASLPLPHDDYSDHPDGVDRSARESDAGLRPLAPPRPGAVRDGSDVPDASPSRTKDPPHQAPNAEKSAREKGSSASGKGSATPGPPPPLPPDLIIPPKPPLPAADPSAPEATEVEGLHAAEPEADDHAQPEADDHAEPEADDVIVADSPAEVAADAALGVTDRDLGALELDEEQLDRPWTDAPEALHPEEEGEAFRQDAHVPEVLVAASVDPDTAALVVKGMTKAFGETRAVDGIDLTVPAGTFYGLVGPNGAGKTTTLSLIAGLLRPDRGTIRVNGIDAEADPLGAKRQMGVLPDRLRTFDRLTGRQLLHYYGVLRGLPSAVVDSRTNDLARAFDLSDALGRVVSDYSAGMLKKVMLAGALIHSPRLLVLDEPFESVDPVSSAIILDILSTYVDHGGTVILSSHGMELVQRVCSRVAVIVAGQVLAEGTVDEVRGELTLEQRFIELAGGLSDVEGLEWLHTFSD
jgi:ABC-2 type transport system ATP-binding protein